MQRGSHIRPIMNPCCTPAMEGLLDRLSKLTSPDKAAYLDVFMDTCVEQARLDALLLKIHKLKQQEKMARRVEAFMLGKAIKTNI